MANGNSSDIGNQLAGVSDGLDRFLEALDASSMGLGSQDALKKIQARAEIKRLDQEKRFKIKIDKLEKTRLKQLTESIKGMKIFNKNMADMAKKGLSKGFGMIKGAMKAGILGAAVLAVKALIDGLLKIDTMMGGLVKSSGRLRQGLDGVGKAVTSVSYDMATMGINMTQVAAEAGNLMQIFGRMSFVTEDIIKLSLQMQKAFGMSAESAGGMIEALTRINVDAEKFVLTLRKDAVMAGTNVSLVMRNIATITKDISIQNSRSVESLKRMAVEAARAGVGVEELNKMGDAFTDPAQIGENIGKAAQLLGGNIGKLNPFKLWNLADQPQKIEDLNKEVLGALGSTVKLDREGNLVMNNGLAIRRSQLKVMSDLSGMTQEAVLRVLKMNEEFVGMEVHMKKLYPKTEKIKDQFLNMQEAALSITNKKTGERYTKQEFRRQVQQGKITKDVLKQYAARKKEAEESEALNKTIKEQQNVLQRIQTIAVGIFDNITTSISEIFGIGTGEGNLRTQIEEISKLIEEKLNLKGLKADVDKMGWVNALENRLRPLAEYIGKLLIKAMDAMIGHMRKDSMLARLVFGETRAEQQDVITGGLAKGGLLGGSQITNALDNIVQAATDGQFDVSTTRMGGTDRRLIDAMVELAESNEKVTLQSEDLAQGFIALKTAGWDEFGENTDEFILAALESGQSFEEAVKHLTSGAYSFDEETGMTKIEPLAKGGLVTRPTHALIGEAGPELVLPLGGGATRILPLSGTQRFQDGGDIIPLSAGMFSGVTGLGGGLTGSGSEARRSQVGAANMAESRRQQAPMMEYWRKEYDRRLDEMEDRDRANRKSWQDYAKQFFLKYETEVGTALGKAFGSGPAGKEMSKALMTGMNAWSNGASAKDALSLGVRAGLTESLGKGGVLAGFFEKQNNILASSLREGLMTFARTGNVKQAGRDVVAGGARALAKKYLGEEAMGTAAKYMGQAAGGRVVNNPGLFMAGEGGHREVIVPTDRIRKGLPINAGVARELGSIGVPGFQDGGELEMTMDPATYSIAELDKQWVGTDPVAGAPIADDVVSMKLADAAKGGPPAPAHKKGPSAWKGGAAAAGAGALMTFADTFAQGGSMGQAASAGIGAGVGVGVGMAATAGLMLIPGIGPIIGPILGPIVGQLAGKLVTGGINKAFGLSGGQKKGRRRAAKSIEQHIKSGGMFDFGQPSGLTQAMNLAIGGKEKAPTEANYEKLVNRLNKIKGLARAGIDAPTMIGLATGKIAGPRAFDTYKKMNIALYGSAAGDKYMKAAATPQLRAGGIVTKPTVATVGEGGPEMIIPLHEQRQSNESMIKEMKEQNKLMKQMIKTQKETGSADIIMDGRKVAEAVSENFYDIGSGI